MAIRTKNADGGAEKHRMPTIFVVMEKGKPMSSKSKKHRRTPMMSITKATTAAEVLFVWAWMDCFHPEPEDVQRMKESLNNVAESVTLGTLRIKDIKEAIRDEHGWEIQ